MNHTRPAALRDLFGAPVHPTLPRAHSTPLAYALNARLCPTFYVRHPMRQHFARKPSSGIAEGFSSSLLTQCGRAFAFAAIVCATVANLGIAQMPQERAVDSMIAVAVHGEMPGIAIGVVRNGKVLFARGYGFADLEHHIPITTSTVFDLASLSKQFTGLAVAMLVEQGRIKLSDDIHKYIPELGDLGHPITIDHLVHHTSGLRDWPGTMSLAGWRMDDVVSFDQILRFAYNQRSLNFVPGAEYTYSNTGYNLLAEMIQRVTGQPFRAWTTEHFFRPLGMTNTAFQDDHTRLIPNRALGYARGRDGTFANVTDNLTALGSSSLFSTVDDMTKWLMNFDDPKVGGAAAMTRARMKGVLNDGSPNYYAYGISLGMERGAPIANHSGGWAGFNTFVLHFPEQHFAVVALANSGAVNAAETAFGIANIYLASELAPLTAPVPSAGPAVPVSNDILDRYTGVYQVRPGLYARIRRDGNTLLTQATNEAEYPMLAQSDTSFWVQGYRAPMIFRATPGQPVRLTYRGRTHDKLPDAPVFTASQLEQFVGEYESSELETRYRVDVKDDHLVLRHVRLGSFRMTQAWGDDFTALTGFTQSIKFQRDAGAHVTGFTVYVDDRSRDVRFVKR